MDTDTRRAKEVKASLLAMANGHGAAPEMHLPAYPLKVWPDVLADYFESWAAMVGAPVGMIAGPAAPIIAGVIGNSRPVFVKPGMKAHPSFWTVELAEPSTGKTEMLSGIRALVVPMQAQAVNLHLLQQALYAEDQAIRRPPEDHIPIPEPEPEQTFFTDNATIEAIGPICVDSAGVCMIRDELMGWLGDMGAYKGGKGSDWQTWLSFWSGQSHTTIHRKGAETIMPENAVVCVCGGLQPDRLGDLAKDAVKDGMLSRFLISCYPSDVPDFTMTPLNEDKQRDAIDFLFMMRKRPAAVPIMFSDRALTHFYDWCNDDNKPRIAEAHGPVRHFTGKLQAYVARFAALFHCLHNPVIGETIEEQRSVQVERARVEDAIEIVEYYRLHTLAAYQYLAITSNQDTVNPRRRVLRNLKWLGGKATRTQISDKLGGNVKAETLDQVFDQLINEGVVEAVVEETTGRPRTIYTLRSE